MLHCLKGEMEPVSKTSSIFKKLVDGQSSKKECQLTFIVLYSPFRIASLLKLTEIGCREMSVWHYHSVLVLCNISEECRLHMIWQCRPWFGSAWSRAIPFAVVGFSVSYTNLR